MNRLTTEQEKEFDTYKSYLEKSKEKLSEETQEKMKQDPYFRGSDYDQAETSH